MKDQVRDPWKSHAVIPSEEYQNLIKQRDELREACELLFSLNSEKSIESRNHRILYQKNYGCFACGYYGEEHASGCEYERAVAKVKDVLTKTKESV